ncbi:MULTISPECIES: bifunctional 2-polyprenyl-6-hydroxyphenol methylase/3-demethylubiquinol 3-O-methyltransferase UbiG [Micromonospora]|uniref:SAM-dependent methyltransferase n=1 Tax=Micromonospora vinacea TaxID=709878 RepID=A0ABS0KBM9_9ACTN|nr:class I SAM-dependent methyltransferase [Micromonospora vinacea]MBG6106037.1 SAM-dependent methyltransferase [Micromonospora vinacea]WSZ77725.1 class I SAM-dependent methyltransferase [Micromonospora sp. NBC_00860]WTA65778.1 class I SAM-dependent methyltransferase [Micromonospora sp. NBC_00855]
MNPHYDGFLADHYTWMFDAPYPALVEEQLDALRRAGVGVPNGSGLAVDLGCGSGFQSVALARMGYPNILAVDSSAKLLAELELHASDHPAIRAVHDDLSQVAASLPAGAAELAVCMGDTLTHLPDRRAVTQLFVDLSAALAPGGRLVLSFRDLTTSLTGTSRFIPVHADDDAILTCFLEYEPDVVTVHDLLHQRTGQRDWALSASSYRKLRIDPEWVADQLTEAGFRDVRQAPAPRRMTLVTAVRQQS